MEIYMEQLRQQFNALTTAAQQKKFIENLKQRNHTHPVYADLLRECIAKYNKAVKSEQFGSNQPSTNQSRSAS